MAGEPEKAWFNRYFRAEVRECNFGRVSFEVCTALGSHCFHKVHQVDADDMDDFAELDVPTQLETVWKELEPEILEEAYGFLNPVLMREVDHQLGLDPILRMHPSHPQKRIKTLAASEDVDSGYVEEDKEYDSDTSTACTEVM